MKNLPSSAQCHDHPRVLAVCVSPERRKHVVTELKKVTEAGGSAILVTMDGGRDKDLGERIWCLDLANDELRVGVNKVTARISTNPRALLRPAKTRIWRRLSKTRPYVHSRPWIAWRALRKYISAINPHSIDHIIIVSVDSWPITWHLCQMNPKITVGWEAPAEVNQRVAAPV